MPFSAADSACDVGARAGAEDGHFACAVGTAVRAESPCGRQTVSATHTTSCIQLAGACGFTHRRTTTPIGGCFGHIQRLSQSARARVFEAKCERVAQACGLVMG